MSTAAQASPVSPAVIPPAAPLPAGRLSPHGSSVSQVGATLKIGGATVRTGDIVAGDCNGVVVVDRLDRKTADAARASDANEPQLLERIRRGEPLEDLIATERTPA